MKQIRLVPILLAIILALWSMPAMAATTADITVTATPTYIAITCDQTTYDFGTVAASATPFTATNWATIDNTSTVQTDQTISVTGTSWTGGVTWSHAEDGVPGADTAGLKANKGGTWGVGDVVVKNGTPNYIPVIIGVGIYRAYDWLVATAKAQHCQENR